MDTKIIELEDQISNLIHKDNGRTVHFEYLDGSMVIAYTYNHQNRETFLLTKQVGFTYVEALERILQYVESNQKTYDSYTVIWTRKGRPERTTSYFYAEDVTDVINKFFEGKDKNLYRVYEIRMNPSS